MPPRPQPPVVAPTPGNYFSQVVNINATISNQSMDLMNILSLNRFSGNYVVDSVIVRLNGTALNSSLNLVVNGQVEDQAQWPTNIVSLYPRYDLRIGTEMQSLMLQVQGTAAINQIEVRLRQVDYSGNYDQFRIPVEVNVSLYDYDTVNLSDYLDMSAYQGYRLIAIEISADAYDAAEKLSLLVDNYIDSEVYVTSTGAQVTIFPASSIIIGSAQQIGLMASGGGSMNLKHVTLRLSRY